MTVHSAGLLLYRCTDAGTPQTDAGTEVLIAHMGGPFWARKEAGAWSIPKGEYDPAVEAAEDAAAREFREELGIAPPAGPYVDLGAFRYSSGKLVTVFAADGAGLDLGAVRFGEFEMEWPPRSGRIRSFPEVDRVEWTPISAARDRLVTGQRPALDALSVALRGDR